MLLAGNLLHEGVLNRADRLRFTWGSGHSARLRRTSRTNPDALPAVLAGIAGFTGCQDFGRGGMPEEGIEPPTYRLQGGCSTS